ncbi:MAG: hypothetical protein WCX28_10435 [Bacteriovoracaceae bacterium]
MMIFPRQSIVDTKRSLFLLTYFFSIVYAQPALTFSGYVVTFPAVTTLDPTIASLTGDAERRLINSSRVRLRPAIDIDENSFIRLEWEAAIAYTSTGTSGTPNMDIPGQMQRLIWNPVNGQRWSVFHSIDRLFFRTMTGDIEWTLGRQRIAWGSGRVWNPTDLFNPLNPVNIVKIEKDGVDAITAKTILGNFTDVTCVWNPQNNRTSNYGIRLRTNISGFDFAAITGRFGQRWNIGGDMTGSLFNAGIRCECIFSGIDLSGSNRIVSTTIGIDNQFTDRLYGLIEYHFNGRGATNKLRYDLIALAKGELQNVGQDFITVQTAYLLHPLVTCSGMTMHSLTDQSGYVGSNISYSASDESAIAFGGQYFYGDPLTEFKYYPQTIYIRFDTFF